MAHLLDKQIKEYLPLLGNEEKQTLLNVIKSFLHLKSENQRISVEQYNVEIEASEKEFEEGFSIKHSELKKDITLW
jgi:hypothetical protein